ncbi:DUF2169 domain-containing protein [Labrys sp. KNU-23]|uniref:DUF2169 family type VI secretion system accessory protein n=1 Tax=Labrys sp. KNU-23 TaxID=2789216 RepID=UPI0011EE2593|nr:DUF2169 domain-containing protein [Labrys sp. KNU-23]QEN90080.1 DUF2169 domain-containing protein [Labrys sp. KNU-23]
MTTIVNNFTHLPNLRYAGMDNRGRKFGVLIVKAAFDVGDDGICVLSEDQEPLTFTDEYHGALNVTSLRYPSDLVPYKPRTDVLVDAVARAPGGKALPSWLFDIQVEDQTGVKVGKTLHVHGPRQWEPKWRRRLDEKEQAEWQAHRKLFMGWELSKPQPITELPLRYEHTYGGSLPRIKPGEDKPTLEANQYNPVGEGWIDKERTDHTKSQPAPQIEAPDCPITKPYTHYEPQGVGPIPPAWLPRRPLGGTYDQSWIDTVWPNWPNDYAFRFHNSAPTSLQTPDGQFMDGEIRFSMTNKAGDDLADKIELKLQNPTVLIDLQYEDDPTKFLRLNLDTLFFDVKDPDPKRWRIFVSGRTVFSLARDARIDIQLKEDWMKLEGKALKETFPASSHPYEAFETGELS